MGIQVVKHGAQFRDLVGLFGDFPLRNDGTLILNEGAPQLDLGTIFADGPFEDFSINGNYLQVGLFQEPCPQLSIQRPNFDGLQHSADSALGKPFVASGILVVAARDVFEVLLSQSVRPPRRWRDNSCGRPIRRQWRW